MPDRLATAAGKLGEAAGTVAGLLNLGKGLAAKGKHGGHSDPAGPSAETRARAVLKQEDTTVLDTAAKGDLGEIRTAYTMRKAGFEELTARLPSNNGFDGVWVKRAADGVGRFLRNNRTLIRPKAAVLDANGKLKFYEP